MSSPEAPRSALARASSALACSSGGGGLGALGLGLGQVGLGDVEGGLGLVEGALGHIAFGDELLGALKVLAGLLLRRLGAGHQRIRLRQTALGLLHGGLGRVDLGAQVQEPIQGLVQAGPGLVDQVRLVGARVDLEQQVAGLDELVDQKKPLTYRPGPGRNADGRVGAYLAVAGPGVDDIVPVFPGDQQHGHQDHGGGQAIAHQRGDLVHDG